MQALDYRARRSGLPPRGRERAARVLGLVLALGCGARTEQPALEHFQVGEAVLPLLAEELPLVEVELDGLRLRAWIDTGLERSLISDRIELPGLLVHELARPHVLRNAAGARVRIERFVQVRELRLDAGRAGVRELPLLLYPLAPLDERIDLALGLDVLGAWSVLFQAQAGCVRLLDPAQIEARLATLYPGSAASALPLSASSALAELEAGRRGPPGEGARATLFDTGASLSSLASGRAQRLGFQRIARDQHVGLGGEVERDRYHCPEFHLGELRLGLDLAERPGSRRGRLGWDLHASADFLLEVGRRRLWVLPRTSPAGHE